MTPPRRRQHVQYQLLSLCILSQLFFYHSWPLRPDRILAILTLVYFAAMYSRGDIGKLKIQTIEVCMIAFTILCGASLIQGDVLGLTGTDQSTAIQQVINISLFPFLFYFVAKRLNYNRNEVQAFIKLLMFIGLYLGLTALCERYSINALIWPSYIADATLGIHYGRARGPLLNSVFLGMILVFCVMNLLTLWSVTKRTLPRQLLGAGILLCMVGVYLTNTRGVWIGLGTALMTTFLFKVRMRRMVAVAIGIVVLSYLFVGASQFSIFKDTLFSKRQNTVVDREVNNMVALKMGSENPVFGIGWGRMGKEFNVYHKMIGSPEFDGWDGNHNEYLGIFAQIGTIALILYGIILISIIRMVLNTYRRLPRHMEFERAYAVSTLGCFLCYLVIAMFSDIHSSPLHNNLVFLLVGIVASISARSRNPLGGDEGTVQAPNRGKTPAGILQRLPGQSNS